MLASDRSAASTSFLRSLERMCKEIKGSQRVWTAESKLSVVYSHVNVITVERLFDAHQNLECTAGVAGPPADFGPESGAAG